MIFLVSEALHRKSWFHVSLHGGVPGAKRKDIIKTFREDPACRVFLSTDAGGVGLNLQSASTVINMDLPWNPAVLEQRIGRVHRIGQHRPVRVINFISERTIEHHMLSILKFKKALFSGVLEEGEDSIFIGRSRLSKFMESIEELAVAKNGGQSEGAAGVAPETGVTSGGNEGKTGIEPSNYKDIRTAAASFLRALAEGLERQPITVEKDAMTGRSNLKIPLPDEDTLRTAMPAMEFLMGILRGCIK